MKTKLILTLVQRAALLLVLSTLSLQPSTLFAQGTAFTYQGRLNDGASPANGIYDLRFTIYDSTNNPDTVIAGPLTNSATGVSNGSFTVTLDPGAGVFDGNARWLEIGVRTNGGGGFTTLAPRQKLSATPYAIFAGDVADGAVTSLKLAPNAVTPAKLAGGAVGSNQLSDNAVNSAKIANDTIAAEDLAPDLRANTFWRLDGNSGTTAGTSFLGTTDNLPLELRVNGGRALRLELPGTNGAPNVIGGSQSNFVSTGVVGATIAGGGATNFPGLASFRNRVTANFGTVGGGAGNIASGDYAIVAGGFANTASNPFATVAGGFVNIASGDYATVGGGAVNTASGTNATVAGGYQNTANGLYATVAGGFLNAAHSESATISGGYSNSVSGSRATVGGGFRNTASGINATVSGGHTNYAIGEAATVSGGEYNNAGDYSATVGGGSFNTAGGFSATVGGGSGNAAGGVNATVGGGQINRATGNYATIPGGFNNVVAGNDSFAAGTSCTVNHDGCFMWSDGSQPFGTTGNNRFMALATGGFFFYTGSGVGVQVAAGGNAWSAISDRNMKENFKPVDAKAVLERVVAMPVTTWNLKTQPPEIRHIGAMAQDFKAAFQVGEDDRHISTSDADGVALAAIQGLNQKLEQKETEISELKQRLEKLEQLLNSKLGGGAK